MDTNEEKNQPQEGRILQGSAQEFSIVPAGSASSSDNGLRSTLSASDDPERTIVEEIQGDGGPEGAAPETEEKEEIKERTLSEESCLVSEEREVETASMGSEGTVMECEDVRAAKRKKPLYADIYSSDESENEALKRVKVSRRQRIARVGLTEASSPRLNKEQSRSDSDLSVRPSEEDERILKMKKGYISRQKRLEIEEIKEEIAREKREENRRKKEEGIRIEEERRKKEEKMKAEKSIMARISNKPVVEEEYISNMTASDLAAMALESLDHIETIRTKCGTMQGALSGELKRRKLNLDGMVKTLQAKAEEKGDPLFLKAKIDELIKKNRDEEEKRSKEINDLKELVTSLTRENKEMKIELHLIKEDLRKRDRADTAMEEVRRKGYPVKEEGKHTYRSGLDPTTTTMGMSEEDGPVMRPPLRGRSTPIPNSALKQKKGIKISEKGEEEKEKKKVNIKVKENIQIKPPRREIEIRDNSNKEDISRNEEEEMEWTENGTDWNQEEEDVDKTEDRNMQDRNMQDKKEERKEILKETEKGSWTEVVKKGRKNRGTQEEKKKETVNRQVRGKETIKRKIPRTAAVSIKGDIKQGFSYADVLRKARTHIKMVELQIEAPRIRKGLNGATIIEISGPDCNDKAKKLANQLQEVLREDNATISTPTIRGDLRIVGLDESIGKEEIRWAIEEEGGCDKGEVRVGEIRRTRRGMGVAWIQCPLKASIQVAKKKKIKIGWTIAGVALMKARPLQCFKCWHYGHVQEMCKSKMNRSRCCFRCGTEGHVAATCNNTVKCAICTDLGRDNTHRIGSVKCEGVKSGSSGKNDEQARRNERDNDNNDKDNSM